MPRKNSILIGDLLELSAALPWWVNIILAITIYMALNYYSNLVLEPGNVIPGQIGTTVIEQASRTFALYGQYVLPFLFLIGALVSVFRRHKRKNLIQQIDNEKYRNTLQNLTWREFELLVGEAFRMRGFSVTETGGGGSDGGIDLVLRKDNEIFMVQCKQWRAYKVSVSVVRELLGVMVAQGATGGFVVTSGIFTREAHSFAKKQNIELIDGSQLSAMIEKVRKSTAIDPSGTPEDTQPLAKQSAPPATSPHCPQCGDGMVKRIAKKGMNAGNVFWGCSGFPKCRGVRAVD